VEAEPVATVHSGKTGVYSADTMRDLDENFQRSIRRFSAADAARGCEYGGDRNRNTFACDACAGRDWSARSATGIGGGILRQWSENLRPEHRSCFAGPDGEGRSG